MATSTARPSTAVTAVAPTDSVLRAAGLSSKLHLRAFKRFSSISLMMPTPILQSTEFIPPAAWSRGRTAIAVLPLDQAAGGINSVDCSIGVGIIREIEENRLNARRCNFEDSPAALNTESVGATAVTAVDGRAVEVAIRALN